jgi:hypothetical protein
MLSNEQNRVVEREVRDMLERSPSFHALSVDDRRNILDNTARVARQLVEQDRAPRRAGFDPYAAAQDVPLPAMPGAPLPTAPTTTAPDDRWRPDERFRAEGIAAGVTQAGRLLKEVDFPAFVSSLVKGTFNAVVDASIQQMKAYGELVNSVAMSITDFADQHVDPGEGQKQLAKKYPNVFEMAAGKLKVRDDFDDSEGMPDFQSQLGLDQPVEDLSDDETLQKLITASRTEIARGRQQLLATTILMGINRIIVTDGKINAKIKFDFTATDQLTRSGDLNQYDTSQQIVQEYEVGIADQYLKARYQQPVPLRVSTTEATSTADITATASLQGSVSLNFKSETFPLEKMVNSDQLFRLNMAQGGGRGVPAAPPPTQVASSAAPPAAPPATTPPAT